MSKIIVKDTYVELASQSAAAWDVYDILPDTYFKKCLQAGIEPIIAQLLHNRGITTPEEMRTFLDARYERTPDPLGLIDMERAVERIRRALDQSEHITVYGDYDADGVTGTAILYRALMLLGARAEYRFAQPAPTSGLQSARAGDPGLEDYLHVYMANRGVLITPFHNMALMSPATTDTDVDRHTELFSEAVESLVAA